MKKHKKYKAGNQALGDFLLKNHFYDGLHIQMPVNEKRIRIKHTDLFKLLIDEIITRNDFLHFPEKKKKYNLSFPSEQFIK